jgi:hypothetical protein
VATIFRTRKTIRSDGFGDLFRPHEQRCSICESQYIAAYWVGSKRIIICRQCALTILPALLADALVGEHGDGPGALGQLFRCLETVQKNFWKAVASAVHRCATADSPKDDEGGQGGPDEPSSPNRPNAEAARRARDRALLQLNGHQ